ncbi:MAG: 50S ribosomal protein L1 [Candidatus Aenigmatarchaeota archaeon]
MVKENIVESIKKARDMKKRNFKQSFDLAINMKNIDLKRPENRVKAEVSLPHGYGRENKIALIVDNLIPQTKGLENVVVISKDELEKMGKDKKSIRNIAKQCSYFIAEAPLMPLVGRFLGPILAPRNLMPSPIAPSADLKSIVNSKRNVIKIHLKTSPAIHLSVGTEDMDDNKIAENIDAVINAVIPLLPKNREQIKNCVIKMTMGKPVKFRV